MRNKPGKFDFLADERQQRTEEEAPQEILQEAPPEAPPEAIQEKPLESAQDRKSINAQERKSTSAHEGVERRSSGQRIRSDLLRAIKIMSAETGTPQYILIEEALESYIARKHTK